MDPVYTGFVLATDARFYTTVARLQQQSTPTIRVRSPQFQEAEWVYTVHAPAAASSSAEAAESMHLTQMRGSNPFVALALLYTLQVAMESLGVEEALQALGSGMDVTIAGDNDYYSHRVDGKASTLSELANLPPFAAHACTLDNVHKTGLGSSAAMTTSLVAALLVHVGVVSKNLSLDESPLSMSSLGLIHNVAQLVHCAAQGKIGSGFDVSASVWGSQLYRRFDPSLIRPLMRSETGHRLLLPDQERGPLVCAQY